VRSGSGNNFSEASLARDVASVCSSISVCDFRESQHRIATTIQTQRYSPSQNIRTTALARYQNRNRLTTKTIYNNKHKRQNRK